LLSGVPTAFALYADGGTPECDAVLSDVRLLAQRKIAGALKPLGLTHVQFVLLVSTWWLTHVAGEQPSQRRIADHAGTDPMMTSQVLRVLASRGLVVREPDPSDSRALRIGITEQGVDLALRAVKIVEEVDAAFCAAVGDRVDLSRLLRDHGA
jgi:DNA-binding MarR family transcriptional regulator